MASAYEESQPNRFFTVGSGFRSVTCSLERAPAGALVAVSVVLVLVLHFLAQSRKLNRLPPGPRAWPVLGNLLVMTTAMPHRVLEKLAAKYGGIMYLRLGSMPCVVISTATAAKEVFCQSNDAIFSNRPKGLFAQVFSCNYRSLVHSPYGPHWRQLRNFCSSELFSPKTVASYRGMREEELRNMMAVLVAESANGEAAINVKSWLFELSANMMTKMLVNKRYFGSGGASQEEKEEIYQLFHTLFRLMMTPIISDYIPILSFLTKLRGTDRLLKEHCEEALRVVDKMTELEPHRERAKGGPHQLRDNGENFVPDFVDMIMAKPLDDGKPLPDKIMSCMLLELLMGGTETASTTVEWAIAEMMAHPDVMERMREELDAVVGRDRLMRESDVPNLPFLQAVVKETFRAHPPVPLGVPRASTQETLAWGHRIPAGTQLILNLRAIHRDPAFYTSPDEFDPKRFEDRPEVNPVAGFNYHELIPFGAGRRMCPGANLGNATVHLMLGNLIHCFRWCFLKDQSVETCRRDNLDEVFGIQVCRKQPLRLLAKSRDHTEAILLSNA